MAKQKTTQAVNWRSRLVKVEKIMASQVCPHPQNPRRHPQIQRDATAASIDDLGLIAPIIININNGYLVDGEERTWLALAQPVDVELDAFYVDLTEEEHLRALLTYDPIGGLAQYDPNVFNELLEEYNTDSEAMQQMLTRLSETLPIYEDYLDKIAAGEGLGSGEDDDEGRELSHGELLKLVNVTIDEPRHQPVRHDVYILGDRHVLICADVVSEWALWTPFLNTSDSLFCPYPGPFLPLSNKATNYRLVMVQPDSYIAGHILDRYEDIHAGAVRKTSG